MQASLRMLISLMAFLAPGDEAQRLFSELYGPRIKQVASTADRADDVELAKDLLAAAKLAHENPPLMKLMCDQAFQLGMTHTEGLPAAGEAMELLADKIEASRVDALTRLVEVHTAMTRTGAAEARTVAAEKLVAVLVRLGDDQVRKEKYDDAAGFYRRAGVVAGQYRLAAGAGIKARSAWVAARRQSIGQITALRTKLLQNANDEASARQLIMLEVTALDQPHSAVKSVNYLKDTALRGLVELAAKSPDTLTPADRLRLADWYRSLTVEVADAGAKRNVLNRASDHYKAFLQSTASDRLSIDKAKLSLDAVNVALAKLGPDAGIGAELARTEPTPKSTTGAVDKGKYQWVDVLSLVDLTRDTVAGEWKKTDTGLKPVKSDVANLTIPCKPIGSYQILFTYTLNDGLNYDIHFPAGKGFGRLMLGDGGNENPRWQLSGLRCVNGKDYEANVTTTKELIARGKHTFLLTVLYKGKDVEVDVKMDDKAFIQWKGPQTSLSYTYGNWTLPDSGTLGLGSFWGGVEFHEVKVRMLDGKLEILRAGK